MLESFCAYVYSEALFGRWENAKQMAQKLPESFKGKFRKIYLSIENKNVESLDSFCEALGSKKSEAHQYKVLGRIELVARAYRELESAFAYESKELVKGIAKEILAGDFSRIGEIKELMLKTSQDSFQAKTAFDIAQALGEGLEKKDEWVKFGMHEIDSKCGGVLKGTVALIGAYTGHGKSAFLASIIAEMAQKKKVGFISLEDPCGATLERIACSRAGIEVRQVKYRDYMEPVVDALAWVSGLNIRAFGPERFPAAGATPEELELAARALVAEGCEVLIVDHLSELRPDGHERTDLTYARGMSLMRSIAIEHGIAVVVACQLKKVEGESSPSLYSFAGSSELVRRSRLAITIHRDTEGKYILIIQKATRGGTGFSLNLEMQSGGTFKVGDISDGGGPGMASTKINEHRPITGGKRAIRPKGNSTDGLAFD